MAVVAGMTIAILMAGLGITTADCLA